VRLAAWLLIGLSGAAVGRLALPPAGVRGHYFTNLTRSGTPIAVAIDQSLSTDTLDNGTAGVWPSYSVEWSGFLVIDEAGTYEFSTVSDDGSELEVADQIVVNNGGPHGPQEARGSIALDAGVHPFKLRYEQAGGEFTLAVRYARAGRPMTEIPPSRLLPDAMSYTEYRVRRAVALGGALIAVLLCIAAGRRRDASVRLRDDASTFAKAPADRSAGQVRLRDDASAGQAKTSVFDRPGVAIAVIVIVGLAVRIVMMLGSDAILWGDSDVFIEAFGAIRSGRFLDHDPHRTLLYPYFLTAFLIWSGEPPMDQIIVGAQHLMGVVTAVCLYQAGRPVFGSRVSLAGALLLTVHTTQLFYEVSILSEVFFGCLLAMALVPMTSFVAQPTIRGAIVVGAFCVVLTLTRPVAEWFFVVPLVLGLGTWGVALGTGRPPLRRRVTIAAVMLGIYLAIMLPWALLNQQQFNYFGVAIGRGFGLFIRVFDIDRLEPRPDTRLPEVLRMLEYGKATQFSPATFVRDELGRHHYSAAQADELMAQFAVETAAHHPWRFAANSMKQWAIQLGGAMQDEAICHSAQGAYLCSKRTQGYAREPFLNRPRYEHEPVRPLVVAYMRHFQIPMAIVATLALFGLIAYLGERRPDWVRGLFLASVVEYFTFIPAFAQSPQDRYRLPIDGLLFMFAVFGLTRLIQQLRPTRTG
jgi:hypothetical protein